MKIYTKTGDKGETSLYGGGRVRKDHPRVAAYGEVDELNSFVGLLVASIHALPESQHTEASAAVVRFLLNLQNRLFDLGAELATGDVNFLEKLPRRISEFDVQLLEQEIDAMQENLKPLKNFILPGGSPPAAHAHVCRSVARRAERSMLTAGGVPLLLITYINRVSDYFFVLARHINHLTSTTEPEWEK